MKKLNVAFKDIIFLIINLILILLIGLSIVNIFIFKDNLPILFNYKIVIGFILLYIGLIAGSIIAFQKLENKLSKKTKKIVKFVSAIIVLVLQVIITICIIRKAGWDYNEIMYSALDLLNGNPPSIEYFSRYPNNSFLLLAKELLFRISYLFNIKAILVVDVIFNVIAIDVAIIYIYKICKKLLGNKLAYLSFLFSVPVLGFTPYITVPYSDTLSLAFPILVLYNYILYKKSEVDKVKYIVLMGVFSTIGLLIKPTNIIILIAISIIEIINLIQKAINKNKETFRKENIKRYLRNICIIVILLLVIYSSFNAYKRIRFGESITGELEKENEFPLTHFMMMGLKPTDVDGKYYGYYFEEDVNATASHIGTSEKVKYNISEIKARLKKMGVSGYLKFLYDKYTVSSCDGSFFYGNEGTFFIEEPLLNNNFAKNIQQYMYIDGDKYYSVTIQIMQSYWIMILIGILICCIKNIFKKCDETNYILKLSIIGIILFILLFEGRSRYLFNYLPIFIILCMYGIYELIAIIKNSNFNKEKIKDIYLKINKFENKVKDRILDKKNIKIIFLAIVVLLAIVARVLMIKYVSGDYVSFLEKWFEQIKEQGGFTALKNNIGDYNVPYLTILAILTYLPIPSLISIKLVSIIFDFVCAFFAGLLVYDILGKNENAKFTSIITFAVMLFLPTILMNSSLWAQCDTIYVSFILISLYLIRKNKVVLSFVSLGFAFAFKLQFIFIMPLYVLLYLKDKNISLLHFLIIPIVNFILCMPAIIQGRGIIDCMTIYFRQTETYHMLTLNYTNLYNIFGKFFDYQSGVCIIFTIIVLGIVSIYLLYKNVDIKNNIIPIALLYSILIVFFLPKMHDRYAFLAEILAVIYVMIYKKSYYFPITLLTCAVYGYYCFLAPNVINGDYISLFSIVEFIAIAKFTWDTLKDLKNNNYNIKYIE